MHVYTIMNDKVYDNMNPDGMDLQDFMDKFIDRIDADIKHDEIPFDKLIDDYK